MMKFSLLGICMVPFTSLGMALSPVSDMKPFESDVSMAQKSAASVALDALIHERYRNRVALEVALQAGDVAKAMIHAQRMLATCPGDKAQLERDLETYFRQVVEARSFLPKKRKQ